MLELFKALVGSPAAWRDHGRRGLLRVGGRDRVRFLNGMVTADVASLREGHAALALQLDRKGHVLAELEVIALADEIWIDVACDAESPLAAALERHIIADDVRVERSGAGWSALSIEGPGAASAAAELGAPELGPGRAIRSGEILWLAGGALVPDGIRVLGPGTALAPLRERIRLPEITDEAAEILRIEAARPRIGVDTGERTFPQEARLERRAVSFQKGCYIGQEIVARIQSRGGVNRLLVKLSLDAEVEPGSEILVGGRGSGSITSAALSPVSGPIALGYVRADDALAGTAVRVGSAAGVVLEFPG
jgi:folate-binding protein YgfZ